MIYSKTQNTKNTQNKQNSQELQINLFSGEKPLAFRMRPNTPAGIIGQEHLLGEGGVLTNYFNNSAPYSIILWGPPGTGKTSIALLVRSNANKEFVSLSGASISVSELRSVIDNATRLPGRMVLFIDEIHRLAKNQQDVLLEPVESGKLVLIGTTTENPHVSLSRALHSRVKVFELKPHSETALRKLIQHALTSPNGYPKHKIVEDAISLLVASSSGDGRKLLHNLEEAAEYAARTQTNENLLIDQEIVKYILQNQQLQTGADPETYYNCVSALQKSIRGSDPDGALYWLARLLSGGADPIHVARRILVTASEDIGLADNNALVVALSAYQSAAFLGMPEARIPLAQAVIYLSCAPKSNTTIVSIDRAMNDVQSLTPYNMPLQLRNLGGEGYKYPHNYKDAKVEQSYLPEELSGRKYYLPNERDKV